MTSCHDVLDHSGWAHTKKEPITALEHYGTFVRMMIAAVEGAPSGAKGMGDVSLSTQLQAASEVAALRYPLPPFHTTSQRATIKDSRTSMYTLQLGRR